MKDKERLCRVVTFITREELDFLDDLAKDIYFNFGKNISRAKLIEILIAEFKDKGIEVKNYLINKITKKRHTQVEHRKYPRLKKYLLAGLRKVESLEEYERCVSENISMGSLKIEVPTLSKSLFSQ